MDSDREGLDNLLPVVTDIFGEWNLQINEAKTEFVHFREADINERREDGTLVRGDEEWCSSKLLVTLMCSIKDVNYRCTLGNAAFQGFKKVWLNS